MKIITRVVILLISVLWLQRSANAQLVHIKRTHKNYTREYANSCQVRPLYCDLVVAELVKKSKSSIVVMLKDTIPINTLIALKNARKRHIDVGIVVSSYVFNELYFDLKYLQSLGADIWLDTGDQLFNMITIDQAVSVLDSNSQYEENLQILHNPTLAHTNLMEWQKHAQHGNQIH